MGEKTMENITEFYSNENLAQTLYSEWMRQNRIGREVDHLIKDPAHFKASFYALLLVFSKLWIVYFPMYLQYFNLYF